MAKAEKDIREEMAELRERIERLERNAGGSRSAPVVPRLPGEVDKEAMRPAVDAMLRDLGIPPGVPRRTPQEAQEQMVRAGVRPEERLGNSILSKMRGYED